MKWKTMKLGDLLEVQNGYAFNSKKFNSLDGMPLIRIRDLKNGVSTKTFFTGKYEKKYIVHSGDFLIGMDGEFRCYQWKGKDALLNQRVCRLQNFTEKLNPKFLHYIINKELKLIEDKTGFITVKHLSSNTIKKISVLTPPIQEQQRIVAKLDAAFAEIDKAILLKKKINDELIQLNSSIFLKLINGPKIKLGDLYEITSSKRVFKSEWKEKGVPFYRAREIVKLANNKPFKNPLYISEEMYSSYSKKYGAPKEGEILITGVGTLGITYVVKKNDKFYFKDGNIIWLKKKNSSINSNYIEYAFKSPFVKAQILNSIGVTVGTLTIQKAKALLIPYPSLEIQNEITNKINKILSNIYNCENLIKKILNNYTYLKNSILKRYLENKVA